MSLSDDDLAFAHRVFDAARAGATNDLAAVIDAGLSPNLTNDKGDTLLILAAYHQHVDTARMLLDKGADVARHNDRGQDALGSAVFRRCTPLVQTLLEHGADPLGAPKSAWSFAEFFDLDDMAELMRPYLRTVDPDNAGADRPQ